MRAGLKVGVLHTHARTQMHTDAYVHTKAYEHKQADIICHILKWINFFQTELVMLRALCFAKENFGHLHAA
jgi:hypothetical protein